MSTHNIGFYEEISRIISQLSSDIIKYAPYLFFCYMQYMSIIRHAITRRFLYAIFGLVTSLLFCQILLSMAETLFPAFMEL